MLEIVGFVVWFILKFIITLACMLVFFFGFLYAIYFGAEAIYPHTEPSDMGKDEKDKPQIPVVPMDVIYDFGYTDITPGKKEKKEVNIFIPLD